MMRRYCQNCGPESRVQTIKKVTVRIDDYGMTHCENCGAELLCNECGDMPDCCPQCGVAINWKDIEEAEK